MQGTEGLQQLERECAEGRTAPRVSLQDIEANIAFVAYTDGYDLCHAAYSVTNAGGDPFRKDAVPWSEYGAGLNTLTICLMVLKNGFTIIGKSAPASPDNFSSELGKKLAYDDAVKQVWPLMGYELRQRLFLDDTKIGGTDGAEPFTGDDYVNGSER